ncbi:hypothetical protein ONS96_004998 [Cadophora gregata f. sp. sojae]|nr:hypothetical protein ONS96_004998 [Cadophora gregata f. sp. sojae]
MSYISQMPLMRARAADDGIAVNEILKYYRVSLLRAQVRLDLDLDGQQYVAEHQTWASYWPGEVFPGVDPRSQVQATTPAAASPATFPADVVAQPEVTISSTIMKEISMQSSPRIQLNNESQPATPNTTQSSIDANGGHNRNIEDEEELAKGQHSHKENRHQGRSREQPSKDRRNTDDDCSTHMSTSPSTPANKCALNSETVICGNCSQAGHSLADCTYNIDEYGYLNGCPRCNTLQRNYADCPCPKLPHDDYHYLITKRHGKPPLRCRWDFRLGYWKEFKDCVYQDDTNAMRPQTAAFAKERRDRGVVQSWNEIVLDPIWYGRTDWTTNVGKMVHPLDRELVGPYRRQVVDLSGDEDGVVGGGCGSGKGKGKRAAAEGGVDEYGRLRGEETHGVSAVDGSVQELQRGSNGDGEMQKEPQKSTMKPWSRYSRGPVCLDERSWKKRRLEDQSMDQQNQGGLVHQPNSGHGSHEGRHHDKPQVPKLDYQQQRARSNHGSISSHSPTPGHQAVNGYNNGQTHHPIPPQMAGPQDSQQRFGGPFTNNNNPSPPIGPRRHVLPNGMTSREYGRQKANEARAKLGPLPGWKPRNTYMRSETGNGYTKFSQNNVRGGFQRQQQNEAQQRMNGRFHDGRQGGGRGNFNYQDDRFPKGPQKMMQRMFDFRADALPPAQSMGRSGMQVNSNGFRVQQGVGGTPPGVPDGPISARIGDIIASRGQSQGHKKGYPRQSIQSGGQGNQQFKASIGHGSGPHQAQAPQVQQDGYQVKGNAAGQGLPPPGWDTGGYCVNCRSQGHVIEECEGNCGLCRGGGHMARDCRFFGLGAR